MYDFYSNPDILSKAEKLAEETGTSEVARARGGWFWLWKKNRGTNNAGVMIKSGSRLLDAQKTRENFLARHLALGHPLVKEGKPTKHYLSLLMWNYNPLSESETTKIINNAYKNIS
jgi:hypothetical protein